MVLVGGLSRRLWKWQWESMTRLWRKEWGGPNKAIEKNVGGAAKAVEKEAQGAGKTVEQKIGEPDEAVGKNVEGSGMAVEEGVGGPDEEMDKTVKKVETSIQVKQSVRKTKTPVEMKKPVEKVQEIVKATKSSNEKGKEVSTNRPIAPNPSAKEPDEPKGEGDASANVTQSKKRSRKTTKEETETRSSSEESDAPLPLKHLKATGGKRPVKAKARPLPPYLAQYNTDYYTRYDAAHPPNAEIVEGAFVTFARYDNYHLFVDGSLTNPDDVPTGPVRLDDLTISTLLSVKKKAKFLNNHWPAEFDRAGMIRATRAPMGIAAKIWANAGDEDAEGRIITNPGWYYLWWRGLHILCGKEGVEAGIYKIRPSFEAFVADGLCFFKKFRAVLQTDPTTETI